MAMSQGLNVREAIASYVDNVLNMVKGMKALLLDDDLKTIVSMVYTQSQILEKSTFLTASLIPSTKEKLDKKLEREKMPHLKGIVMCRATKANLEAICQELANPMYGEYNLFFSNTLPQESLRVLAEADRQSVVKLVMEVYCDYLAVNKDLFELGLEGALKLSRPRARWSREEEEGLFRRAVKGVLATLLSLRQKPTIRYQGQSELCQHFARALKHEIDTDRLLFEFGSAAPPSNSNGDTLLLVLDRRDDPVTPLLSQWTYQSMVHQLIGIKNNIVSLEHALNVDKDLQRVVLAQSASDEFFCQNMYLDYGQLSTNAKRMLDTYKSKYDDTRTIKTIEDMQNFVESFPEFKKLANNASKHVAIVGELARLIDVFHLLDISVLEQDLVSSTVDHAGHLDRVKQKVLDPSVDNDYKVRLVMLYALKYESYGGNRIGELKMLLRSQDTMQVHVALVDQILSFGGAARRAGDVFGSSGDFLSKTVSLGFRGIRQVTSADVTENIYTQHKPLLYRTLEEIKIGKLSDAKFPSTGTNPGAAPATTQGGVTYAPAAKEVIVFMLGGTTFEEATMVANMNAASPHFKVLLGGTNIHNAKSFLGELMMLGAPAM